MVILKTIIFFIISLDTDYLTDFVFGSLVGFLPLFIIILITKGGMGAGDMKLFSLLGGILGVKKILIVFFISIIITGVFSIMLMLLKIINRKSKIPFGPFICISTFIVVYFEEYINYFLAVFYGI